MYGRHFCLCKEFAIRRSRKDAGVEAIHLLPPAERAKRYRTLASEALARAQTLPGGEQREAYVSMAMGWATLAENCEKLARESETRGEE